MILQCSNPEKAKQERYQAAINNLNQALKIARNFLPENYLSDMKDITLSFDKTAQLGGRSNIAQYEHSKRKISISEEYTYANPQLVGAYLINELVHGKDNDAYTSIKEEQDAYRAQAQYWVKNVENVHDPEMDYVANLYKQSAKTLDNRVAEIYRIRDPYITETSYNHPPKRTQIPFWLDKNKTEFSKMESMPIRAYDIIV